MLGRNVISGIVAILLAIIIGWGWLEGMPSSQLIILIGFALFFTGATLPSIYDKVPNYTKVGLIVIGIAGSILFLSGHGTKFSLLAVALGAANGIDIFLSILNIYEPDYFKRLQ